VRIAVPDLEHAIALYRSGEKEKMLSSYFFTETDSYYARHKFMYDYVMLAQALKNEGFQDVRRCRFQEGCVPDLTILDKYPDESLYVEAVKTEACG